jgi:hypothetical protein
MPPHRGASGILLAPLALICLALPADSSVYDFSIDFDSDSSSYIFSEGPMYALADAPFGSRPASVSVHASAYWDPELILPLSEDSAGDVLGVVNVVFVDSAHDDVIGYERSPDGSSSTRDDLCCTQALADAGECSEPGELHVDPSGSFDAQNATRLVKSVPLVIPMYPPETNTLMGRPVSVEASFDVDRTGEQLVAFFFCPLDARAPPVSVSGRLAFENPYGFLSGKSVGFLPFYALMVVLYLGLMCAFLFFVVRHCASLLWLQWCLFGLIVLGFVEACGWLLLYLQLNYSGVPVCCPLYSGAVAAVVINVVKRAVSRCLLLSVCLGFGVVRPVLPRRISCVIAVLGVLFVGFATYADIRINNVSTTSGSAQDPAGLPVTALDVLFVTWTYYALVRVQDELEARGQGAKLAMYAKLSSTLTAFVLLWISFALFTIAASRGSVPLDWRWQWTLHSFWHVAYFAILCVVACVWAPSPTSHQYAYSHQLATSAEEADAYEMDDEGGGDEERELGFEGGAEIEMTSCVEVAEGRGTADADDHGVRDSKSGIAMTMAEADKILDRGKGRADV